MSNTIPFFQPKIYVMCLAAHQCGQSHGAWIDVTHDAAEIHTAIKAMLSSSPIPNATQWFIQHWESFGDIHPMHLREYSSVERIVEVVAFLEENGDLGQSTLSYTDGDLDNARELIADYYCGEFGSAEAHALYVAEELRQVPNDMLRYINRTQLAHALSCDYRCVKSVGNGGVYVFHH